MIDRVVEPTSLLDVDRVLAELGRTSTSLATRKRTLRRARGVATETRSRRLLRPCPHRRRCQPGPLRRHNPVCRGRQGKQATPCRLLQRNAASTRRSWSDCLSTGAASRWKSAALGENEAETLAIVPIVNAFQACHGITI